MLRIHSGKESSLTEAVALKRQVERLHWEFQGVLMTPEGHNDGEEVQGGRFSASGLRAPLRPRRALVRSREHNFARRVTAHLDRDKWRQFGRRNRLQMPRRVIGDARQCRRR